MRILLVGLLLTSDIPAPPDYLDRKRTVYLASDASWAPFFDAEAELDWREVTWGGVNRDGRLDEQTGRWTGAPGPRGLLVRLEPVPSGHAAVGPSDQ